MVLHLSGHPCYHSGRTHQQDAGSQDLFLEDFLIIRCLVPHIPCAVLRLTHHFVFNVDLKER